MSRQHHEYIKQGVINANPSIATLIGIEAEFERHYISVVFFTDDTYSTPVMVSTMAGTVDVSASDNGIQFGSLVNGEIALGSDSYLRPSVQGTIRSLRMDFSGITTLNGANNYRIYLNSHRG